MPNDKHNFISKSHFEVQQDKKKYEEMNAIFPEENNSAKLSIKEFYNESLSNILKVKKKLENSYNSNVTKPFLTDVENVIEISDKEIQSVDSLCNELKVEKNPKKFKRDEEFLNENRYEIFNEGKNFETSFSTEQKSKGKKYTYPTKQEFVFTDKNSFTEIINDKFIGKSACDTQIRKKFKKSEKNKDIEQFFPKENNCDEIPKSISNEPFCNVQKLKKEHKKSNRNNIKEPIITEERNGVEKLYEDNKPADLFCNGLLIKKKHKKLRNNKDKEPTMMEERNMIVILNKENQLKGAFYDELQAEKKLKKSNKNKAKEAIFTEQQNAVKIIHEKNQPLDMYNIQWIKKKSKKNKDKELTTSFEEWNMISVPNEENQSGDMFCDTPYIMKRHKKSKKNKDKDPSYTEIKKNVKIPSVDILSVGNEKMINKKLKKSKTNEVKESTSGEESDIVETPIGSIQSGDMSCDVQFTGKRHKKYKKNNDKDYRFTEIKSSVEISNDDQPVYLFCNGQLVKEKDKNDKPLKKEIDRIKIPNEENQSGDMFCNIKLREKKHKKSKKYKDEGPSFLGKKNSVEISNDKIQSVDLLYDVNKIKMKHKKSKRNEYKQSMYVKERNMDKITVGENESCDMFCDVPHIMKIRNESKKNKDNDPNVTEIKNTVEIAKDKTQSLDSFCDVKMVKKLKYFKMNDDNESINSEDSDIVQISIGENPSGYKYCDVEKRSKKYKKDKEHTSLEEINMIEIPNGENQYQSDDMFCYIPHTEKKCKKSKTNKYEVTSFTEIKNSVEVSKEGNKSIYSFHDAKKKHKSKMNKNKEYSNVEESEIVEIPIKENQSGDLQHAEKEHRNSRRNEAKELTYTETQNVVNVPNKENQFVNSFCNVRLIKKRLKNLKKNKEKESILLAKRIIGIPNEENQSVYAFCNVQYSKKKHKKSEIVKDKDSIFTEVNSSVEILNDEMQSVDLFCDVRKVKKKHEEYKRNEDNEYINKKENNVEIPTTEKQSTDIFWDVKMTKEKYKKSIKKKSEEEENVIDIENEQNEYVDSFCGSKKKKHKKCKDVEEEEIAVIEESNLVDNPIEKIIFVNKDRDVQQVEKKYKKSKKSENNKRKITGKNNDVKIANEQNKFIFSISDKLYGKKKSNKSESNMNKETLTESNIEIPSLNSDFKNSFHGLKQLKKTSNKLKQYNDKDLALSVENLIVDTPNEECHLLWDSFCNDHILKKNCKKSEYNTIEKPTFREANILNKTSLFNEGSSLDIQEVLNIQKCVRNNSKAAEHLPSSNMIHQLQEISEMSDIDDKTVDDSQNSNKHENFHSVEKSLLETDSFLSRFCEEPVDFDIPPLHAFENLKSLSDRQKNELLSQGVTIRTGRYTREEDKILHRNYENFTKTYGTLEYFSTFGRETTSSNSKIKQFLKATHFYVRLGKGLNNRTLKSISCRARSLLHPYRNKGKLSQTELENINHLRLALNKKWTDIEESIEQPASKIWHAFRHQRKCTSQGKWTVEEEKELIAAIEKITGSSDLSYSKLKNISWEKVATYVPSRNPAQCRYHWAYHLGWKSETVKGRWNKNLNKKLVEILRSNWYIDDTNKIDWIKVHESFKKFSPSPFHVQRQWNKLKIKITNFKKKDYKTLLDELCNLYEVCVNNTFKAPLSLSA